MLALQLLVIDRKLRVPDVGLGQIVAGGHLVLVLEVGVLDVLCQLETTSSSNTLDWIFTVQCLTYPIHGPVHVLCRDSHN